MTGPVLARLSQGDNLKGGRNWGRGNEMGFYVFCTKKIVLVTKKEGYWVRG